MKKSQIILAAVPIACALGGFGAGQFLKGDGSHAPLTGATEAPVKEVIPQPMNEAEAILQSLASKPVHKPAPTHAPEQHSANDYPEKVMPASLTMHAAPEPHRIDYAKLEEQERKAAREAAIKKARAEQEKKIAQKMENPGKGNPAHPSLLPIETEAKIAEDAIKKIENTDEHVVKLGRLTVPVRSAKATTYFVADFGVSVTDLDQASHYYTAENATRLRDQIVMTMHEVADTQLMRGPEVDSKKLAERVAKDLRANFFGVEDFIFLSLYRTDVPRG